MVFTQRRRNTSYKLVLAGKWGCISERPYGGV
ncbi:MAG: hypothetical protein ACJATS_000940, partial [Psychroserpens sp.]